MQLNDLLKTKASDVKAPPRFPAGMYEVVITRYEMLPFHWKNKDVHGLAYVPTLQCVRSIEADDESQPEVAEEQRQKLEEYGDWTKREFTNAYTDNNQTPPRKVATVSEVNFPLVECDSSGEPVGLLTSQAWRFYLNENNQQSGFVVDTLGLAIDEDEDLESIIEKTQGAKFIAHFEYEPRHNDPSKEDLRIVQTMCIE